MLVRGQAPVDELAYDLIAHELPQHDLGVTSDELIYPTVMRAARGNRAGCRT